MRTKNESVEFKQVESAALSSLLFDALSRETELSVAAACTEYYRLKCYGYRALEFRISDCIFYMLRHNTPDCGHDHTYDPPVLLMHCQGCHLDARNCNCGGTHYMGRAPESMPYKDAAKEYCKQMEARFPEMTRKLAEEAKENAKNRGKK